jgi:hypothetical protein
MAKSGIGLHRLADVPSFMKGLTDVGTEDFHPEDITWVGENAELSDQQIDGIVADTFSVRTSLKPLLLQIIRSHPNKFKVRHERRLDIALRALADPNWNPDHLPARPGRRPSATSEEIVADMAMQYFSDLFDRKRRSISELARSAAGRLDPEFSRLSQDQQKNRIYDLRRIFGKQKDELLVKASTMMGAQGRHHEALLEAALMSLEALGIVSRDREPVTGNTNP